MLKLVKLLNFHWRNEFTLERHNEAFDQEITFRSFTEWLKKQKKSENTVKTYSGVLTQFFEWAEKDFGGHLSEEGIQAYLDHLETNQRSAGTIEKHYMALKVYCKYLGQSSLMKNIDRKINEQKNDIPEVLTLQEQKTLLKEVEADGNLRNTAMVYIMLHTGVRVSELCDLNDSDLVEKDEKKAIIVRNSKNEVDRIVPLSQEAIQHIGYFLGENKDPRGPLFLSSYGQRITPRSVQYMLKKYHVNPHKLRHTFCQQLIDNGVELQTVSKLAGHKDLNMTKRYVKNKEVDFGQAIDQAFS